MKLTKEVKQNYEDYIISAINPCDYGVVCGSNKELLQFLFDTFTSEQGWEIERIGKYKAFINWLQGLPTAISLPFYNSEIIDFYKTMTGVDLWDESEKEQDKIIDNYFNFMMCQCFRLFKKYKINVEV